MFLRSVFMLLAFLLVAPIAARAQNAAKGGPPGYAEAINQALLELDANNYPEAREEFRRAHTIYPNARTLRGLGMVEFELRNYAESVRLLNQALASNVKPLEGKLRSETESLLDRARRYIGTVVVRIDPPSASLTVDGLTADARTLQLEVGDHTLEAQAPGRATERRVVKVAGNTQVEIKMSLRSLETAPLATATSASDARPSDGSRSELQPAYKKWWVWTLVAVVAAGGATAAVLLTRDKETHTQGVESSNTPTSLPMGRLQTLERF